MGLLDFFRRIMGGASPKDAADDDAVEILEPRESGLEKVEQLTDKQMLNTRPDATPDKPHWYGKLDHWMAVKADSPQAVAKELGMRDAKPCNWETGSIITSSTLNERLYISGPANGWVFLFGHLPEPDADNPREGTFPLLLKLSKHFEEVQFFTYRADPLRNGWARASKKKITRAYYFDGAKSAVIWNEGEVTDEEFACDHDYGESGFSGEVPAAEWKDHIDVCTSDEATGEISRKWSIDPARIHLEDIPAGTGLIGVAKF